MDRIEKQCKVTKTIPILSTVNHFLQQQYDNFENESPNFVSKGGVTKDLKYAWIANGLKFQVIEVQSGSRIASWLFDGVLRDKRSRITCVAELPNNNGSPPLFVIGLDCETSGGMIYIFNIMGSKIMRAIQLDDRVCNLYVIDSGDNIPGILKNLDGIIAIGTCGGDTYLIDLCKQMWINETIIDDINYSKLFKRSCSRINLGVLETYRSHAIHNNDHLALQLNVSTNSLFLLSTPQGTDALQLPRDNVRISAFLYVPKLISILVGYNFGAWQIFNLLTLELEYTSPVYDEIVPVSHFAYQEPSDDPRAFCYVWAVYSNDIESKHASVPLAAMYALAYESKDNIEFYGTLYQNFMSCSLRFQMDLLPINNGAQNAKGGNCISLQTCMINSSNNVDSSCDHNLTLCMIVWSVWSECDNEPNIVMAVIDLDQWYKEQMPATLRNPGNECYIAQFDLSRILNIDDSLSIFDVNIDSTSINPFTTVQRLEEHYYPTALTFDFVVMQKSEFTFIKNNGLQRTLLLTLEKNGVNSFLNAQSLTRQCSEAGLHSTCSLDMLSPKLKTQHTSSPHTHLLSLALEYNLIGLLTSCAEEWATGAYASAGCTLGVFVEWATQRSEVLQQKANELCVSLFDYSDINLDCNARKILDQCAIQMHHLSSVFKLIKKNCTEYLNSNATIEINEQLRAIQMFSDRLEVLQWLLNVGLLPEAPIQSYDSIGENERMRAPYPFEQLYKIYNERRSQLNVDINPSRAKNKSCELLFIDNLIEYECGGEQLRNEWRCDTNINGLYPPPSIQALLRTYLIDNVDLKFKHTILVYVFLDLAVTLDQTKYESIITHLIKFPAVFRLTPCHIKMTQAFWQLDHGDFTTGMEQLLDPLIGGGTTQDEFKSWQHRTVLRTLLANKQHKYAALYIQIRQPPFTDLDEIINAMHLLLSNNMLHAAFEFQRRHQTVHNKLLILEKFFEGCLQENLITSALKLSLSQDEEDSLFKVLKRQNKEDIQLQLIYYLQRSRGFDVLRVGDQYYHDHQRGIRGTKMGLIGQNSLQLPQILLNTYASVMPSITKKIYDDFRTEIVEQKLSVINKVQAPTPMSVKIKNSNKTIKYKSNSIVNSINKIREIWTSTNGFSDNKYLETTPFLCTPKRKILECQSVTPVTYPKVTYQNQEKNLKKRSTDDNYDDDDLSFQEQNPCKRFRFSSNATMSDVRLIISTSSDIASIQKQNHTAPEKLLLTPIVKRKYLESPKSFDSGSSNLPSILKIRHTNVKKNITRGRSITPQLEDCMDSSNEESSSITSSPTKEIQSEDLIHGHIEFTEEEEKSYTSSKLGATPRKNLVRTPRPVVHFEDVSPNEAIIQTSETSSSGSPPKKIKTRLSEENNSLENASNIQCLSKESKLREEEMKSVARKLSRSSASPYKSIKPRKSLQRTVLESSLVKNITPVLKRSKRIANRRESSGVNHSGSNDQETIETDNESFEKNVTICSSPTSIEDNSQSPRKSSRSKKENSENFSTSSFSSDNNSSSHSVTINTNLIDNDNSNVTDSFINRINEKYSKNIPDSSENSEDLENQSIEKPKHIITRIGNIIAETKENEKNDEISLSFNTSEEVIFTSTNVMEAIDDSIVTESFIERMEAKFKGNNPNNTTNVSEESSLEVSKIIARTPNESIVTVNLKKEQIENKTESMKDPVQSCIKSNSNLIVDDKIKKSTEKNDRKSLFESHGYDSIVTESFLERMAENYVCEEDISSFEENSFECPKPIPKRLGEMIAETVEPTKVDINIEELISQVSNENKTSHETRTNLYAEDDSLVTKSFIERMENKYENCELTASNVSVANSTSIYNSIDTNKDTDVMSSKETSSVYCSAEQSVEDNKNSVEDVFVSDDDYSFRMEVDDDEDEDEVQELKIDNNSNASKESSNHDISDDSESVDENQQDPNEIVEISSDEDEKSIVSSNNETEESSEFEENNSSDSSNSSLSNNQDNETKENDTIGFNKCIVFEKNSSDSDSNENIAAVESVNQIIEISEVTAEEEVCDVYEELDVEAVVEMAEDNQESKVEDNPMNREIEVIEILAVQEVENETQPQENNKDVETDGEDLKSKLLVTNIEIPAIQQEIENETLSKETNKFSHNDLLVESVEQEIIKAIETDEIQKNDIKISEESEKLIETLTTNENQQQIESQNNSNENLLINTNSDVHDEQNLNSNTEFRKTQNITEIENQEEMSKLKTQQTNMAIATGNELESHNRIVLITTESSKKIDEIQSTDENQSEKKNIEKVEAIKPRRRTRQSSVDSYKSETPLPVVQKPTLRSRRATSIDISSPNPTKTTSNANTPDKRVTRSSSDMNVSLNQSKVINSKSVGSTRRQSLRSSHSKDDDADKSILEEYSTSRRLTRKQKTMLEKTMSENMELSSKVFSKKLENNESDESDNNDDDEMRGSNIEKIDPIKLLDKQTFEGPADPEEQKLLQRSPASSIRTTSSFQSIDNTDNRTRLRNLRSRSIDLDIPLETNKVKIKSSSSSDIVGITTPKRRMSRRLSQLSLIQTPEKDEIASESGSQISTRSKNHIAKLKDLSPEVKRSPRRSSRLGSPQLQLLDELKGPSTSMKSTRRSILTTDLPVISEESAEQVTITKKRKDTAEHIDSPAKRNRSKSSDVPKTSIKEETKPVKANRRKKP